ncbi:MAG: hypothetical protein KatS3mg105_1313 [Gemmatales bacterium]|nr:MAG: hypothetical protein KatS3mg105_1313 [Gemmatales bacterium]
MGMGPMLRMRNALALFVSGVVLAFACLATEETDETTRPYGILKRIPWRTSRITGSPEPPPPYRVQRIFPKQAFQQPVEMVHLPGTNRICVVERLGKIYTIPTERTSGDRSLFFDGPKDVPGLTAVYGLAFHPKFAENRFCYVCYIRKPGDPKGTRVCRFRVTNTDPPRIDPKSETLLLDWLSGGHNGGSLKFGPDGYLYISTGDGTAPSPPDGLDTGQDISDLLGSILRIDVDRKENGKNYAVPKDNPFVETKGARPEVWAYGLRNPWRMSFDRKSGDLWVGDVGWQLWEMVYRIERGGNYGWSIMEGPQVCRPEARPGPTKILPPVFAHPRADAASITGGFVYHGEKLKELRGAYIYGDYVTGKVWALRYDEKNNVTVKELADTSLAIIVFYEAPDGELALLDYNAGTIHELVPNRVEFDPKQFPRKLSETGLFSSVQKHKPAPGVVPFSVNVEQWSDHALAERWVAVPNAGTIVLNQPKGRVPTDWGTFPKDTVLVKTLSLELERGKPETRRRIETQILHFHGGTWRGNSGEWFGYSYVWNEDQTDADLVPANGMTLEFDVVDPDVPGGKYKRTWRIASRTECYSCHNPWAGYRLAFTVPQLNKVHDYGGIRDEQLRTLQHIDLVSLPDPKTKQTKVDLDPQSLPKFVNPYDETQPLEARARSYLHVNCAHCHRFGGGGNATILLRWQVELKDSNMIDVRPAQGTFGIHRAAVIAPGDPYRSVLYYRTAKLGAGRMPYLGSRIVDEHGIRLLRDWIASMPETNGDASAVRRIRTEQRRLVDGLKSNRLSPKQVDDGIDRLLATTSGALMLMEAVADKSVAESTRKRIIERANRNTPPQIRDLFERFLPPNERRQLLGAVVKLDDILRLRGNADAGKKLFFEAKTMQCKNCHRIQNVGGVVGPDLSHIGKKYSPRQILENIIEPSKVIEPEFITYLVETKDGRVLSGVLAKKSATEVVLRDAQAREVRIAMDNVERISPLRASIMPELLHRDMTAQELADLVAFLASLK